ncbi:MAG: GH25 family lysozyme [Lachnospiraceae bacterium]|nr:GH25 family lysozyme [Lachnospiraceae bacterium]
MNGRKKRSGVIIVIVIVVIAAAFGAVFGLHKKYTDLKSDYHNLEENKNEIVNQEVADRLEEVRQEKEDEVLECFREGLGTKSNTLKFLRETYKDKYLVYQISSNYLFEPILNVEMADYSMGDFVKDDTTGFRSFQKDGKTMTEHVIDVSKYQGEIDWTAVKNNGIEGAMIRAGIRGYGSGEITGDALFDQNMQGALAEDLKVGVYFFSEAVNVEEAEEEADFVIKAIKPYKVTLPVTLDLEMIDGDVARNESVSKEDMTEIALTFMKKVKDAGYEPMLYGNIRTISEMVDLEQLADYKLWFAYYSDDIYIPYKVDMWQYASDGKVDGIETDCDLNMMFIE